MDVDVSGRAALVTGGELVCRYIALRRCCNILACHNNSWYHVIYPFLIVM